MLNYWSVVCGDIGAVAELLVVFVVTVGLLLKFCRVVCGDSGAVAELIVVLMDSCVWFWVLLSVCCWIIYLLILV